MRILIVEDEKHIADFIKKGLKEEGYSVDVAYDGEKGYFLAGTEEYDAIVLDLMIPKLDGISLCKKLRHERINTPIIILTAKDSVNDKVAGLDCGAEDYLTKPFAFKELLARIRVLLRKGSDQSPTQLCIDDLVMDLLSHKVTRAGEEIVLTTKEFVLLEYLIRNVDHVLSRTMIAEHVWDINFDTDTNVIDVHINALRKKIDQGRENKLIQTVRGRGYSIKGKF
ncbi:MAG: response regulator transcription factor [Candidatus Omnitrophica bacterium]|nr:response regulator transcription factor [Candidatus Omnitrophota bacterium]